ncbi:fumarylacetoacetate hydrolase family protein [Chloroflexota bacterium]
MKLVTFEVGTAVGTVQRIGALRDHQIIDLHAAYASYLREARGIWRWQELAQSIVPPNILQLIENGDVAKEAVQLSLEYLEKVGGQEKSRGGIRLLYQIDEVRLMAPIPRPVAIRDCMAFFQHVRNTGLRKRLPQIYHEIPAHYRTSTTSLIGPDAPILWPSYTEKLDYELEFAVCIGKQGVNIPVENAEEYIFGYTIYNDISARDIQMKEMTLKLGPAKGKSFQNSNIMGPCLVTPDEIDVNNLRMIARINGEVWSDGNSSTMNFNFPQLIAYLSKDDPIYPGEFIGSGTVGLGCGLELDRWLKPGDVIELEVEGIGILRNKVERGT